jgi:Na+-translocating ferredoxin:NAD+ oxidoreductase subunit G
MEVLKVNKFKEYFQPTISLLIICFFVTGALALTYNVTAPIIAQVTKERADAARLLVLPNAKGGFAPFDTTLDDGIIDIYFSNDDSGAVITSRDKGFGGNIKVMTGFDNARKITGIKLLEHKETPGLGTKVMADAYLGQYMGMSELDSIDAITGATISSMAMFRAIDKSMVQLKKLEKFSSIGGTN